MSSSVELPPLNISQLNDIPSWESSAQHHRRSKITFALRHVYNPELVSKIEIKEWSIHVYRVEDEAKDLFAQLICKDELSNDNEENIRRSYEYLIFLFKKALGEEGAVFVLSTNTVYKHIRNDCSMQFPRTCSQRLSSFLVRIQQVSMGQIFGSITDSSIHLQGPMQETINQSGLVYREFTALGSNFKVKFKENGILIYKSFTLEQYVTIIEDLTSEKNNTPIIEWTMSWLPDGNLIKVSEEIQEKLHFNTCRYLVGLETVGWTFSLRVSERWYSNATNFRLCTERRLGGFNANGGTIVHRVNLPNGPQSPDLDLLKDVLLKDFMGLPMNTNDNSATDTMKALVLGPVKNSQVIVEYQTINGQWYGNPLIDCIDGWIRTNQDDVYFKLGTLWYQIHQDYISLVQEAFDKVIAATGCLLVQGQSGYLHLPWISGDETSYNRSYLALNPHPTTPSTWFDGNQKFRKGVELFDILQIANNNQIFIYHVKKSFDTHIKEAVTQLVMSAQIIYNTRNTIYDHLDAVETFNYCKRVSTEIDAQGNNRLYLALKTGTLHFVLAFRSNGYQGLLKSATLIAKREVIRAKEEIEKLGFVFRISQIPLQ